MRRDKNSIAGRRSRRHEAQHLSGNSIRHLTGIRPWDVVAVNQADIPTRGIPCVCCRDITAAAQDRNLPDG
jgi:hypothetical protein